jgi:hypothetical protein
MLPPIFPLGDALPIDPGVQVIGGQGIHDLLGEGQVFTGVGDEDVGHFELPHCGYRIIVQEIYG